MSREIEPCRDAVRALVMTVLAVFCPYAMSTENGGSSKALGVDTVLAGVMPPPGLRMTTYVGAYEATKLLDGDGNPKPGISNFKFKVSAVALRFQYVWPGVELWGANVETRLATTVYANPTISFDLATRDGPVHRSGSDRGVSDSLLAPLLLGWHGDSFHQTAGIEFFLPTGDFTASQPVSLGRGYTTVGPAYWFTWFPTDTTEVSVSSIYLYNWENSETDYKSGDELNIDFGLGYALTPAFQVGASGYLYKQISDDKKSGQSVPGGNRGQAVAIGPFLRYHPTPGFAITFKWQHEAMVRNRTEGNRYFLQVALPTW